MLCVLSNSQGFCNSLENNELHFDCDQKKISFSHVKVQLGTLWGLVYVAHNEQAGFV